MGEGNFGVDDCMGKPPDGVTKGDVDAGVVEPNGCALVPNLEFEANGLRDGGCTPSCVVGAPKGFIADCAVFEDGAPKTLGAVLEGAPKPLDGGFENGAPNRPTGAG